MGGTSSSVTTAPRLRKRIPRVCMGYLRHVYQIRRAARFHIFEHLLTRGHVCHLVVRPQQIV